MAAPIVTLASHPDVAVQMHIHGKCHCGNITFVLDWPGVTPDMVARECGCSFCVKHGGSWTSHRDAKLSVTLRQADAISRYVFGTKTAMFYICTRCGAVPIVTSEIENHVYAVVNVNTFENVDSSHLRRQSADFDGEEQRSRLARRQKNWIADVRIVEGAAEASVMRIDSMSAISEALTVGVEQGGLLLGETDLAPSFYDLSSGIAGELFQKFVNYRVPLALVVRDPAAHGERFVELAREHRNHALVRIFSDQDSAAGWLATAR